MKNIKLFEQFRGIESSILESFLDNLETEAPGTLKTSEVIDPKEPPKESEIFIIWRKWLELQIRFGAIIGKVSEAREFKEDIGQFSEFGIKAMYDLIKER